MPRAAKVDLNQSAMKIGTKVILASAPRALLWANKRMLVGTEGKIIETPPGGKGLWARFESKYRIHMFRVNKWNVRIE